MMKTERECRLDIVEVCRRIHQKGFISASDGNVSIRFKDNRILITPGGINKGFLQPHQIVVTDKNGALLSGSLKPSSEIKLHVFTYKTRPDVKAIIHAHPPLSVAFSLAGVSLARCLLPEVVLSLGEIPTAQYATPSSAEGPEVIKDLIQDHDAIILDRHGTLTVGKDVFEAYNKLEKIEHTAQVTLYAKQLGNIRYLSQDEVNRLISLGQELGLDAKSISCQDCGSCGKKMTPRNF